MVESKKALPKEPRGFNFFAGHYGQQPHPGNGSHGMHGHYYSPAAPAAYPRHIYGYSGGYGNQVGYLDVLSNRIIRNCREIYETFKKYTKLSTITRSFQQVNETFNNYTKLPTIIRNFQ